MSSDAPHRIINTRERGTSTDINRIIQLSDRNATLATWYAAQNDQTLSGVLTGLRITVSGDTVTVSSGLALHNDGVASYPDSPYRWIEVAAGSSLAIGIGDEKETGEWMVIEISAGVTTTITTNVDVFDPTTGAFVSTSLNKEVQSGPVLTVRTSGTANQFPSGVAAKIPLAYIFDTGGALTTADMVSCRPLLWSKAPMDTSDAFVDDPDSHINHQMIQGGGIEVTADGTTVRAMGIVGRFFGHRQQFNVSRSVNFDLSDANIWDGGVVASSSQVVYLYAMEAPYPPGYDPIAKREFVVGIGVIAQFATLNTGVVLQAQTGCIVFASTVAPDTGEPGIQGPISGTKVITDVPFRNGGSSVSVTASAEVYLGAIDWATTQGKAQDFILGESRVIPRSRWPVTLKAALNAATVDTSVSFQVGLTSGGVTGGLFPVHANSIRIMLETEAAVIGDYTVSIKDDEINSANTSADAKVIGHTNAIASSYNQKHTIDIIQQAPGLNQTVNFSSANLTECDFTSMSYIDPIIAAR